MSDLRGIFVVMITPLNAAGDVDFAAIDRCVDWWIEGGVHGILPLGSTGDFASLSEPERAEVSQAVVEAVKGRVPVVVGASAETTAKAVQYAEHAAAIGAAGVMVLPSYFYRSTQEEIVAHFRAISAAIDIPIMVYNNPRSAKTDILPETVVALSALPGLQYIKESTNDIKRITEVRTATKDGINVFCGCEHMAYESFVMGAKGWVCVIGNIAPKMAVQLYEQVVVERDFASSWELYQRMLPTLRHFEQAGITSRTLKYVLSQKGLCEPYCRLPQLPLTEEQKRGIDALTRSLA